MRAVFSADVLLFRRQHVAGIQTTISPLEASASLSLGEESIRIPWAEERFSRGWASLAAQLVKNPPAMRETWIQSLGWEDLLEKEKATHSSILAWRIPWTTVHGVTKTQT